MRALSLVILIILITLAQALAAKPLEASQSPGFNIESKNNLVVKGNWSTNLTGVVEVSKIINFSEGRVEAKAWVYAKLADRERGLNFTLNVNYNTSTVLGKNFVESKTQFKVYYVDYGALARLAPTGQVPLEAIGSISTTIAEGKLNSTLEVTIKPSTGNRLYNFMLAGIVAYILNETLGNVREELQKMNATLEYKVTLAQGGTVVELEAKAGIPLRDEFRAVEMETMAGASKIKATLKLEQNQTTAYVELETLSRGGSLREALETISYITNTTPQRLEETLDRANRVLDSLGNLITTLNESLANINTQQGGMVVPGNGVVTPKETPVGNPIITTVEEAGTPTREGRGETTLTLLLMGVVVVVALIAFYIVLTRRKPIK